MPDDLKKSDNQQVGYLECIVIWAADNSVTGEL